MSALRRVGPCAAVATLLSSSPAWANWAQPPAATRPVSAAAASTETGDAHASAPVAADVPPGSAPSTALSPPPTHLQRPMTGPSVRMHTNNSRARLQQQLQLTWTDVCAAPCGGTVDPNGTYRLGGGTLRPTDPFRMPRADGVVRVSGNMGSNVKHWVGLALGIGGVLDAAAGVFSVAYARHATGEVSADLSKKEYYTFTGIIGVVSGAVLLGIGTYMFATSSSSAEIQ